MAVLAIILLLSPLAAGSQADSDPAPAPNPGAGVPSAGVEELPAWPGELRIDRGPDLAPLYVPRNEKLTYRVRLHFVIDAPVGTVTLESGVEPYQESILLSPESTDGEKETAWVKIHAKGDYSWYSMDATIESRILPQAWPQLSYYHTQMGSETRRREILVGQRDGQQTASYRKDTSDGAPAGTRIWRDPKYRAIEAEGVLDMLSALHLARTLVREEQKLMRFPLIDKLRLWQMRISRGDRKHLEVAAGTFDAVQIQLEPSPYPGEEIKEDKVRRFEGLFGLKGSIQLWTDRKTGIPVLIHGSLPVGFLSIGLDIELESYSGTPPDFQPID